MSGQRIIVRYPSGNEALIVGEFWGPGYVGSEQGAPWKRVTMAEGWPAGESDDGKAVAILVTEASYVNGQRMEPKSVAMLDPRAVCEDESSGERLFAPSTSTPGTARWVVEWLHDHPEWPPQVERRRGDQFMCDWCHSMQTVWAGYQGMKEKAGQEVCRSCMADFADRQVRGYDGLDDETKETLRLDDVARITRLSVDHDITFEQAADWFYHGEDPRKDRGIARLARDCPERN